MKQRARSSACCASVFADCSRRTPGSWTSLRPTLARPHGPSTARTRSGLEISKTCWLPLGCSQSERLNRGGKTPAHVIEKLTAAARIIIGFAGGAVTDQVLATLLVHFFDLDELEPYGLRDTDEDTEAERKLLQVEDAADLRLGWHSEVEYFSPDEWRAVLSEAKLLLKGLEKKERLGLALADQENVGTVVVVPGVTVTDNFIEGCVEKFRQRVKDLGTCREAQKVALEHCIKEHGLS